MKYLMISIALMGATATASAYAQSNPSNGQTAADAAQMAPNTTSAYSQLAAGETRPQIYQELVQAKQDGQLAYLNKTIYAHH
jgi:hypothetical protein